MNDWRAFGLAGDHCFTDDGKRRPVPASLDWTDIGTVLHSLAPHYGREGVLLLSSSAAQELRLPWAERVPRGGIADHPAVLEAGRAGWTTSAIGDWSTFRGDGRPVLHVAITPVLDLATDREGIVSDFPLFARVDQGGIRTTVRALRLYQDATKGIPWHGNPGMACLGIQRELAPRKDGTKGSKPPTWKPHPLEPDGITRIPTGPDYGPDGAAESDLLPRHFTRRPDLRWTHGYDWNRAYISAMILLEVAPWTLKHTGRIPYSKRLAGWWQVELPHHRTADGRLELTWNHPGMPHPAGYSESDSPIRWVTGPTMALLEELTAEGVFGGVRILDSWTGPARDWVMRPLGECLRDAYTGVAALSDDPTEVALVRAALKQAGREGPGLWNKGANWIYRPDWWYALVALTRCNIWRAMWREGKTSGRWPLMIDRDQMWYESELEDPVASAPKTFRLDWDPGLKTWTGLQLGRVKPKATRNGNRRARKVSA
jgi:hypothetical protein